MLQRYLEEMTAYTEGVLSNTQHHGNNDRETTDDSGVAATGEILFEVLLSGSTSFLTSDMKAMPPAPPPSATTDPSTEEEQPPNHRPFQSFMHQIFNHGPFVLDIRLLPAVLNKIPHGKRDEFTHARHTAITRRLRLFSAEGYSLRTKLFSKPRQTDIVVFC